MGTDSEITWSPPAATMPESAAEWLHSGPYLGCWLWDTLQPTNTPPSSLNKVHLPRRRHGTSCIISLWAASLLMQEEQEPWGTCTLGERRQLFHSGRRNLTCVWSKLHQSPESAHSLGTTHRYEHFQGGVGFAGPSTPHADFLQTGPCNANHAGRN